MTSSPSNSDVPKMLDVFFPTFRNGQALFQQVIVWETLFQTCHDSHRSFTSGANSESYIPHLTTWHLYVESATHCNRVSIRIQHYTTHSLSLQRAQSLYNTIQHLFLSLRLEILGLGTWSKVHWEVSQPSPYWYDPTPEKLSQWQMGCWLAQHHSHVLHEIRFV